MKSYKLLFTVAHIDGYDSCHHYGFQHTIKLLPEEADA